MEFPAIALLVLERVILSIELWEHEKPCQQMMNGTKVKSKSKAKTCTGKQKQKHSPLIQLQRVYIKAPMQTQCTARAHHRNKI